MLASCAVDVKFHDWESGVCLGSVDAPDKARGFLDISWCNEAKHLIAVPLSGKSVVVTPNLTSASHQHQSVEDRWRPNKDIIDIVGIKCASYSTVDNPKIIIGTATGEVFLYNSVNKQVVQTFADLPATVNMIAFGAQDLFFGAGCDNGQIFIYNGADQCPSASYFVPCSSSLTALKTHSRIPYLLAGGSEKGVVAIWDVNSGSSILQASNHTGAILDMAFSVMDDSFTTIGSDQKVNIFDLRTSECVHDKQFDSDLTALAYCPNGTDIAVGTGLGQVICLDVRYLHSCKGGLKAHKCAIRKISFDTDNIYLPKVALPNFSKTTVNGDLEDELPTSVDSELKTPGSGDFSPNKSKVRFSRNMYQNVDKCSVHTSKCQMGNLNYADRTTFHIIDENSLNQLRDDIMEATKGIVSTLVETMNNEFLKMRMGVSREFCTMEIRNKKRWQEFNMALLKIADEHENGDSKDTVLSQVKTKLSSTHFLQRSNKSVK